MTVTFGTPPSIAYSKVRAFLADLGVPIEDLLEVTMGVHGVSAEFYARNQAGLRYFNTDRSPATHRIAIPLDRAA